MSELAKITEQQMDEQGVCAAPNILNGTPAQNKAIFDRMIRQLIAPAYNALVDAVELIDTKQTELDGAEESRQEAEAARKNAETERSANEMARERAEEERKVAEEARGKAESLRAKKEAAREDAEAERAAAEAARVKAEAARETAEKARAHWEEYQAEKNYPVGSKVAYGGSSYLCLAPCVGVAPPNDEYWLLIAARGTDGAGSMKVVGSTLIVKSGVPSGGYETYSGAYTVRSSLGGEDAEMETEHKLMRQNVTVEAVGLAETSNTAGGKTLIVGG